MARQQTKVVVAETAEHLEVCKVFELSGSGSHKRVTTFVIMSASSLLGCVFAGRWRVRGRPEMRGGEHSTMKVC